MSDRFNVSDTFTNFRLGKLVIGVLKAKALVPVEITAALETVVYA